MDNVIKYGKYQQADLWMLMDDSDLIVSDNQIIPVDRWMAYRVGVLPKQIGVELPSDYEIDEATQADLLTLPIIAINFKSFSDGRGYSLARLLKERYDFKGELRAIGDILPDQLCYLYQVGFDSFALRQDVKLDEKILDLINQFPDWYQSSYRTAFPLFKRRR